MPRLAPEGRLADPGCLARRAAFREQAERQRWEIETRVHGVVNTSTGSDSPSRRPAASSPSAFPSRRGARDPTVLADRGEARKATASAISCASASRPVVSCIISGATA